MTQADNQNQPKSDIEQAVDNIKVDKLSENLADSRNTKSTSSKEQTPANLSDTEKTAFIDDELRTDK